MIDAAGEITGAEAVVDVHNTDAAGAGIEHREQRGQAAEAGTVANARRHGDDGAIGKTAENAGECAFHAGNGDDDAGAHDLVKMSEGAMQPGDADVVEPDDVVAEHGGGDRRFFGDGNIAGAAGGDDDGAEAVGFWQRTDDAAACVGVVGHGKMMANAARRVGGKPGDENGLFAMAEHGLSDAGDLLWRFVGAVDHFCDTLAQLAVHIHLGVADVFEGLFFERQQRVVDGNAAAGDIFQQLFDICAHGRTSRSREMVS